MPNNDDQLQQQYQEILNKYASSLTPPVDTPKVEESIPVSVTEVQKPESLILTDSSKIIPSEVIAKPIVSEPIIKEKPIAPPIYFPPEPVVKKESSFFKYLFYFSLLLFIVVAMTIIYSLFNIQQPVASAPIKAIPSMAVIQYCELGDSRYEVGQSFPSPDTCNTCSCTTDLTIACTTKACISPTPVNKIPGKVYKDSKYGYQFECPTTAKYQVVATSIDGNKIPYKVETCTDGELITTVSVYDNTVIHSFGNTETQISPDKKYVIEISGDDSDIFSSFKFL